MFEGDMYKLQRNDPYNVISVIAKYDSNRYGVGNLTIKSIGAIACADYSRGCVTNNDASLNNMNLMFRGWGTNLYVDWIKVRPYTSIEPSWSLNGSLELADAIPPTNPTAIVAYDAASKGSEIDSDTWHNYSTPHFEWSGASDEGSNVNGYWVYWGEDSEADPLVSGTYQTSASFTSNITLENSKSYYLRLVTQDDFGNQAAAETLFNYKYDNLAPDSPEYVNVSPVGCSTASSFDFNWPDVLDSDSGLMGYEYRRGSGGDIISVTDPAISVPSYQDGDNVIYVRSQDNAGNVSPWQTAVFCSTGAVHIVDGPTVQAGPSSLTTTWVSTKPTTSSVRVYEGNTYISEQGQTSYGYNHTVKVIGLEPEREYRYQIAWSDQSGNIGESDWYTTNTAQAPQINNLKVDVLSTSQVNVSWTSSIQARATIEYGTTDYEQQIVLDALNSGSSNKIENLKPGARYMLRVSATGADGTRFYSGQSFDMPPLPEASEIRYEPITDLPQSALKVTWKTNVLSSSSIFYGVKGEDKKEITKSDLKLEHEIRLEQLSDNSQYEIYVAGADSYGNQFKSSTNVVTTEYDSRPAQISAVVIESSNVGLDKQDKAQIAVSWKTDEPTSSQVEYAEGISGSEYTNLTTEDKTLTTNHLVIIPNLTPSTPYHVRISVVDRGGNVSKSEDHTVIPGDVPKSALQIILATFQRIFGWLGL